MPRLSPILTYLVGCAIGTLMSHVPIARAGVAVAADTLAGALPSTSVSPTQRTLSSSEWDALNLGRAVDLWLNDDLQGAAELLATIDITPDSEFDRADRAAFLLAVASLLSKDVEMFHRVADRAADDTGSPYRRWIRLCQLIEYGGGGYSEKGTTDHTPPDLPGASILTAALLIEAGRSAGAVRVLDSTTPDGRLASIHFYMRALAREAVGDDATGDWRRLAKQKARSPLEADLIATALLRLATDQMRRGADATEMLERVPRNSRRAPHAAHIRGLAALEAGDTTTARELLTDLIEAHPDYEARREVELALGGLDMEKMAWRAALDRFEAANSNWRDQYDALARLEDDDALDDVWRTWEERQRWSNEIRLAPEALIDDLTRFARASLDLGRDTSLEPDKNMAEAFWPLGKPAARFSSWAIVTLSRHQPDAVEWASLRLVRQQQRHVASVLARQERLVDEKRREITRRLDYLRRGRDNAAAAGRTLGDAAARLEALLARLDAAVLQLDALRDSTLIGIATRTREMTESIQREVMFIQAIRHFHVNGPGRDRPERFPEGVPTPAELLTLETALAHEAEQFLSAFEEHYGAVIDRSFAEIWKPRLTGDSPRLYHAILAQLSRARRAGAALDSTMAGYADDPSLLAAVIRRDQLAAAVDSLRADERTLRGEISRAVAARGRQRLNGEREAIDYHRADAAYELAVDMATDPETTEDATLVVPSRARAIARLDTFLARYPESIARAEGRFRLADLRLMEARDDFHAKMESFLGEKPSAADIEDRSLAPFVNYAPAVSLYEAILSEDPDFPHIDAVLFNLGMILSDDGRPDGEGYLVRLVEDYPDSPDCQEAWLRMGNDRFDRKDFAGCVAYFEEAFDGGDPSYSAIALYKLGWAHFERDRFEDSADAFRRLIDLYIAHGDVAKAMDLRDEAQEYLVLSLARSGGADAFRVYFDGLGGRDYEAEILITLGHLMRSVSLYEDAVACDELWLSRYPGHPKALSVAQRLVDTYRSWNKPDAARQAKLLYANRFRPGSAWFEANTDAASRAAATTFAQSAYREAAAFHHHEARRTDSASSWLAALANYEDYLTHWPDATDARLIHYMAGETAGRLDRYALSLNHFATAAGSAETPDTLAVNAAWQLVAVSDAWYRHSVQTPNAERAADGDTETGADSLAARLYDAVDRFVRRHPSDKRCADVIWRQGNVAYAHGWYAKAATAFASLNERYPGDPRTLTATRLSGDAHYHRTDFEAAGAAYEKALALARTVGTDTLVAELEKTIPLCYYKHAENVAGVDDKDAEQEAAPLFARVAQHWPGFEHADLALYRAGLGFASRGSHADAVAVWEQLLAGHNESEYARDSAVQIAKTHEASGNAQSAARAYERFSQLYPEDPDAPEALLRAVDLLAQANDERGAEEMRGIFMNRFPGELETVMEFRSVRAAKELAAIASGGASLAVLLAPSQPGTAPDATSELFAYLALARQNPELASPEILAQVDYLEAKQHHADYASLRLTQPLPQAIEKKKTRLEGLLKRYDKCTRHGVAEYSRASAFQIGRALIEFGDALMASERPRDLGEDDLVAYEEVIKDQSWEFYERGADVWSELLQKVDTASKDTGDWIARTQQALWPRLGQRFLYRPEVDYPLVAARPPEGEEAD